MKAPGTFAAVCLAGLAAAAAAFAGPESPVRRRVLPNGLTAVTQTDVSSSVTVVEIVIGGGASVEPAGLEGISHLTTRLAVNIPDETTSRDFTVMALKSGMASRDDDAVIHLEFLTEFADPVLKTITGIFNRPIFSDIRINRLVESMNHQRRIRLDDARSEAHLAQRGTFFGTSGYAGEVFGSEASLEALKVRAVKEFYEKLFVAANITVVAISDLAPEALDALVDRHFASLRPGRPSGEAREFTLNLPPFTPRLILKEQQQSVVSCAFTLPALTRRDFARVSLIENVLGRGAGSRLWELRFEKTLAYSVFAQAFFFKKAGFLEAYVETDGAKTAVAREALETALRDFRERGMTEEELAAGRAVLWAGFLRANETKASRATTLGYFESTGLGAEFFKDYRAELDALTLEEVNAEIRRILDPARASWVTVGPKN